MNAKPAPHLEFAPPAPPGMGRAWLVAGMAHAALFVALGLATAWKTQNQTVLAEAELWSSVPRAAAPKLQEPTPPPPTEKPKPKSEPVVKPKPQPAPEPEPDNRLRDAQIALEKKKLDDQKKKEAAERQRLALEKKKKEAADKAAKDKAAKDKAEKDKAEKEKNAKDKAAKDKAEKDIAAQAKGAQDKIEADKKKAAEQAKEDAASEQARRQENLQRIQGMAGASGGPNATGTALQSSGPSASYAGRLVGRIKPNITYPGDVVGNARAEVEVRVAPDGTIISRRIVQSSGIKAWDDAVLRAIDKTEIFPRDTDGRVPPVIVLGFRPMD